MPQTGAFSERQRFDRGVTLALTVGSPSADRRVDKVNGSTKVAHFYDMPKCFVKKM